MLSDGLNWLSIILAGLTAVAWIKAASAKVQADRKPDESLRFGETIVIDGGDFGNAASGGIFVSDDGKWIDLPKTMRLQARWNATAAWLSAGTAATMALAEMAKKLSY
jgi:hypothetical protein